MGKSRDLTKRPGAVQILTSVMDQMRWLVQFRVWFRRAEPKKRFSRKLPKSESKLKHAVSCFKNVRLEVSKFAK